MKRRTVIQLVLLALLPVMAWATDVDSDGLPDDWELAHGRDPTRPDYVIASGSYSYYTQPRFDYCTLINGSVNCSLTLPPNIVGLNDIYDVKFANQLCVYHGQSADGGYRNCTGTPPMDYDVNVAYEVPPPQPTSFTATKNEYYSYGPSCVGTVTNKYTCVISGPHTVTCSRENHWLYQPAPLQCATGTSVAESVFTTRGVIAHIAGDFNIACALTEFGPECFGGTLFSGVFDPDGDGVNGLSDAFPLDASESVDTDSDGIGNHVDPDADGDDVLNVVDNCPMNSNADQLDTDGDAVGNLCDPDDDSDGFPDSDDAFPLDAMESLDTDKDGVGNNADADDDSDGIFDVIDNCPLRPNASQLDTDLDGAGNACDNDDDNDGVTDSQDVFPLDASESADADADDVGDNGDNCPSAANTDQLNTDGDSQGNACDLDDDNDGQPDDAEILFGYDPLLTGSVPMTRIISFETGTPSGWTVPVTASVGWVVDVSQSSHLVKSLRSGMASNSSKAQIQFVANIVGGGFMFDLKTSTEALDVFRVYVDGIGKLAKSGEAAWQTYTVVTTPGVHTIRFEYLKNASGVAGSDAVWIDKIVFVDALDIDADGIANTKDLDDDNDGVPDYIDAEPLNAGNAAEVLLPVDNSYKGSAVRASIVAD